MQNLDAILHKIGATKSNDMPFRPVKCTEEKMLSKEAQNGFVYFTTDSHKIYCGLNGEYIPMGGTTGIYYGSRTMSPGEIYGEQKIFSFLPTEIESNNLPTVNDLILNVPDGGFYRVIEVTAYSIEAERLMIAGGGGGGTTGGGGTSTPVSITIHGGAAKVFASDATTMPIEFTYYSSDERENRISQIAFSFKGSEDEPFYVYSTELEFNEKHTIDLIDYKSLFNENAKTVIMMTYDLYGGQKAAELKIQTVSIAIKKTQNNILAAKENTYPYVFNLSGATSKISEKGVIYNFYTENDLTNPVYNIKSSLDTLKQGDITQELDLSGLSHGVYVLQVQAYITATGSTQPVYSNILTHKIISIKDTTKPLLAVYIPDVTEQYTNIVMDYMFMTGEDEEQYSMAIRLNNVEKTTLAFPSNTIKSYSLYFEKGGQYTLDVLVQELSVSYTHQLNITKYTGELPVIDGSHGKLELYLNPRDKSNSDINKHIWNDYNNKHSAILTDLHYGGVDGWLIENNTSYLSLTSGGKLSMPDFRPFKIDPLKSSNTNLKLGYGVTVELDFEINGTLNYSTELIKCISHLKGEEQKPNVGFTITGDTATLYGSTGTIMSLNLVEGERTRLAFVIEPNKSDANFYPMAFGYLNGKLSKAVLYSKSMSFEDNDGDPATLTMDSTDARLKIYGIRIYYQALSDNEILNNYIASFDDLNLRQKLYDSNNVYSADNTIDYLKVTSEAYQDDLQIPYMLLTGGYANVELDKWKRQSADNKEARLPVGKKDYRAVDVKVIYPKTDLFAGLEDYEFKNIYKDNTPMAEAYNQKPTNGGAIMYAQGTSSMEYPVKNLRLRFKKDDDWYRVKTDIDPVEIICMKADYMESSGSHNTGAGNLIDRLYKDIQIQTPGQQHFGQHIVTCIKGYPCLIFYSPTGAEGSYTYVGKYNLNLDKATPEPFGFNHDDSSFGYLAEGDKYYKVLYYDEDKPSDPSWVGQANPADGGDYYPDQEEIEATVAKDEKINSIHCFEFLDNAVEVCNFVGKRQLAEVTNLTAEEFNNNESLKYYIAIQKGNNQIEYKLAPATFDASTTYYLNTPMSYKDTWYGTYKNADGDNVPGWALGFESRYPEDRIGQHDADMLYPLASWLNELYNLRYGLSGVAKDEAKALCRFKSEYECYLNKEFTLAYYIITEALLMADSRVKNMMIATWGKEERGYYPTVKNETTGQYYIDSTATKTKTNNYIFYPIFYDMDTMMGLDNTGKMAFSYYAEDTNADVYNGDEVLWTFVRDALQDELASMFKKLEGSKLNESDLFSFFDDNQAELANEAFYNGDAQYKYITPAREGYFDYLNKETIGAGKGPYLYAAQGDRASMRKWFMTNRLYFLRGKYVSSNFTNHDRIVYRQYFPGKDSEFFVGHENSLTAVPPSGSFDLTSIKTGYAGLKIGANGGQSISRFDGATEVQITVPNMELANGTESYILGLSGLSDVGDLSNKYMQKFIIDSSDVRLKHLKLGNAHRDYYNPYWNLKAGDGSEAVIDVESAQYLETFNLQNCSNYTKELKFNNCQAIHTILLTGSGVSAISLPVNGVLRELRLPSTLSNLDIEAHHSLTDDGFAIGGYVYDTDTPKIGEGSGYYTTNCDALQTLRIVDTPINGYNIVKHALNLKKYYFQDIAWNITNITDVDNQYCIVPKDKELDETVTYYIYNGENNTYVAWDKEQNPTRPTVLYQYIKMLDDKQENIINIPVLDYLATLTPLDVNSHADALSGTLTINVANVGADEYAIYSKYIAIYPKLKIVFDDSMSENVTRANNIQFYTLDAEEVNADNVATANLFYEAKAESGKTSLSDLIKNIKMFENGPFKGSTTTKTYSFNGVWKDYVSQTYYYQDDFEDVNPPEGAIAFSDCKPSVDMKLFPCFTASTRFYTIKFYNYNYNDVGEDALILTLTGQYEQKIIDLVTAGSENAAKLDFAYRPDTALKDEQRYAFKGWKSEISYKNNEAMPSLYDLSTLPIRSDMNMFAHHTIEDARINVTPAKFFVTNNIKGKYGIAIKKQYKDILKGKITVPSTFEGRDIYYLGGVDCFCPASMEITHIFFLQDSTITEVYTNACKGVASLKEIYLPSSVRIIQDSAFEDAYNLKNAHLNNDITTIGNNAFKNSTEHDSALVLMELPSGLTTLGSHAFACTGTGNFTAPGITIDTLPIGVTKLNSFTFNKCPNVAILNWGTNNIGEGLKVIGERALEECGSIALQNKTINILPSVQYIGASAFKNFGGKSNMQFNFYHTIDESKQTILYYASENDTTTVTSPKGNGSVNLGITLKSMECEGTATYCDSVDNTYVEE